MKRLDWALRCGVLALLFLLLPPRSLSAQPQPPPGQSGTPEKDAPQQAAAEPADAITIPDGTPLTLQLVSELSSRPKKGATVQFVTASSFVNNGLVLVPMGTSVFGTVVGLHRSEMSVAFDKVALPSGEVGALRSSKAPTEKAQSIAGQRATKAEERPWVTETGYGLTVFTMGLGLPAAIALDLIAGKKHQQIYPEGIQITVYFNGPLHVDRGAVLKLQSQSQKPYQGRAQVFFTPASGHSHNYDALFCDEQRVAALSAPVRMVLSPGTYSFIARPDVSAFGRKANKKSEERFAEAERESKLNAKTVQLEVQQDHQYWIEWDGQGLFVKDLLAHQAEFDLVQYSLPAGGDFSSLDQQDSCPQAIQPAAQTSATVGAEAVKHSQ